ncbi:MAG: LL-diaminopimelate aminotransferase [Planctomycetes bacterium]|nr:LL-diaminopimelate aminotransferase [Planctomycetota bacterium]
MQTAERLSRIEPYLFMTLRQKIAKARANGVDVISLAIGDPVEPTPAKVVEDLCRAAGDPANHRYPTDEEKGMLAFRKAVAKWYKERYRVELEAATEVLGLIGSKEGVHHFCLGMVNPGDVVLMTDPGYPAYKASIVIAGGVPQAVPLAEENRFLIDFSEIPTETSRAAKAIFLNYPNNPTGAVATREFFAELAAWAGEFDVAVCHDNPYSEIVFDGQERLSFLEAPGAKEVGIELNSLSKPFNMTGWRIGMAMGNRDIIAAMSKVKSNTDSGIFNAVQFAGIKALEDCGDNIDGMLAVYDRRRRMLLRTLSACGLDAKAPRGTFYLWVGVPDGTKSAEFAEEIFDQAAVVVAAGSAYGPHGEGFIRFSLTVSDERLEEACRRLRDNFGS